MLEPLQLGKPKPFQENDHDNSIYEGQSKSFETGSVTFVTVIAAWYNFGIIIYNIS